MEEKEAGRQVVKRWERKNEKCPQLSVKGLYYWSGEMGVRNPESFVGDLGSFKLHGAMGRVSPLLRPKGEFSMLAVAVERGVPDPHSLG